MHHRRCGQRAQLGFVNFAHIGHRHGAQHRDGFGFGGAFVHTLGCESKQLGFGHLAAGFERGKGHRHLARVGVWRTDCRTQGHRWVCTQGVFNHFGVDVVAAADDQVFGAARQVQAALRVDETHITRDEPTVGRETARCFCGVQITRKQIRPLVEHHALLACRQGVRCGLVIAAQRHDAHTRMRQRPTHATGWSIESRWGHGAQADGFGHAQALVDVQTEGLFKALRQLGRQWCSARTHSSQG